MSQADNLIELFKTHGNRLTLGEILAAGSLIGSKYTNRISDVRRRGYKIRCEMNHEKPTENVYYLEDPIIIPRVLNGDHFEFDFGKV